MLKLLALCITVMVLPVVPKMTGNLAGHPTKAVSFTIKSFPGNIIPAAKKQLTASDPGMLKEGSWYTEAMKNLEQKEYEFHQDDSAGTYTTPNRHNNLRFHYSENGFTAEPRITKIPVGEIDATTPPDEVSYTTLPDWMVAFTLDKEQTGNGTWQINGNRAEYQADNITVQYLNNEEGMRQNFIVHKPLSAGNHLKLRFSIQTTLEQRLYSDRLQFTHPGSGVVLNYDQLKVWDASGQLLEAAFEKYNNDYCIHVRTQNAVYPITIDPISTTPAAMLESNQDIALLGYSLAGAGDVNGDGYSDVIAGAYFYDNGQADEGAAFIYHGSATGISTIPAVMLESNQFNGQLGYSVAGAGDVNSDGYSDVIVGVPQYTNGETDEGAAFIYHGSATGLSTTPAAILESNQAFADLGTSVASAGDVNGDGYSDVITGVLYYDNEEFNEGAAFIYHGSTTGINVTSAIILERNQANSSLGFSVAGAGDVNGDGYSDVIVGAYFYDNGHNDEGAAFIYHGSATGISTIPAAMLESNQDIAYLGYSVAGAGDVNGDGYSDVVAGAYLYDNGEFSEGAAFIYHGSAAGISTTSAAILESNQDAATLGYSVACAGDVNGDGYSDVITGANLYNNGQADEGAAFIYHGSATGISTIPAVMLESNQVSAEFGNSVASAGDVNGDGYSDVIVGAYFYDNGQPDEGAAFTYHGSATGISTIPEVILESNQASASFGFSVAGAGDVNGDGYSDVIVGAYRYDNGQVNEGAAFIYHGSATGISTIPAAMLQSNQANAQFGLSVSGAGDVNGDGFSDVIVGAQLYDNGQTNEGAAFVYHGSASGINTTAAIILERNQASASFGNSVAGTGDVNGDGYSDVIVGANVYDNGESDEGAAFIYHGSVTGISIAPAAMLESNQADAWLGYSVAGAGDVNGDGYSDVIVGAPFYNNGQTFEGTAFIYHGSVTGISIAPAAMLESNQDDGRLGNSVAGAGDINGDGYSDVIVGAFWFDNGQEDEGAAFIYHGSATGVSTTASTMVESNQTNSQFGTSVAGAGDVNGDGYSDVVAGAYLYDNGQADEGAAFIYHGSATGINTIPAAMLESNQAFTNLGTSVAGAGDVNGDGYSDVIAGVPQYTNGQSLEGTAFTYYGNGPGSGIRNNLRLYNTDLTTPVNSASFSGPGFGASIFAKSFSGRTKGKLVWETRVNYSAYSGTPITNSALYTSAQSNYTDLGTAGIGLKNLVAKVPGAQYTKIRVRVKYDPVTSLTGQVYGPWRYVPSLLSTSSLGVLPVDLISFKAEWLQQGMGAQLTFVTDNEASICCYDIEKSSDGISYNKIGSLDAKNTGMQTTYYFTDNDATAPTIYYRLKINHNSGNAEYSNIQWLQNKTAAEILVFPNPATHVLQLRLNNNYASMNVQIINSSGKIVTQYRNLSAVGQLVTIPVSHLATGTYFLSLQSGNEKQVLQFVKQ
jgi:hypothetical protein